MSPYLTTVHLDHVHNCPCISPPSFLPASIDLSRRLANCTYSGFLALTLPSLTSNGGPLGLNSLGKCLCFNVRSAGRKLRWVGCWLTFQLQPGSHVTLRTNLLRLCSDPYFDHAFSLAARRIFFKTFLALDDMGLKPYCFILLLGERQPGPK